MKIVIIGVIGFVGICLVECLYLEGEEILVLICNLEKGKVIFLFLVYFNLEVIVY